MSRVGPGTNRAPYASPSGPAVCSTSVYAAPGSNVSSGSSLLESVYVPLDCDQWFAVEPAGAVFGSYSQRGSVPACMNETLGVASVIGASLPGSILVGSVVSMVPKYAVITSNCGMVPLGSVGLGSAGVCTKAAARNVCFPQARAERARQAEASLRVTFRLYQR